MSILREMKDFSEWLKTIPSLVDQESKRFPYNQSNACIQLDSHIRDLDVKIADWAKKALQGSDYEKKKALSMVEKVLKIVRAEKQALFNQMNCENELEKKKLNEVAAIISKETKLYDEDVLNPSKKRSQSYLLIGGGVILAALFIILYSSNKK